MPLLERPDNAHIAWESDGPESGPAVLLIMGLGYPAAMWFRQMPALAERYRVIRVDNRGAGHTGDVPATYQARQGRHRGRDGRIQVTPGERVWVGGPAVTVITGMLDYSPGPGAGATLRA